MKTNPFRVGLIGTGKISDVYLKNCADFEGLDIMCCGSLNMEESKAKAAQFGIPNVATPDAIIADPNIDGILNLTIPAAHAGVSIAALESGKHVYSEKPFVTDLADGQKVLDLAAARNLAVGNAPDTFLGGRWQTLRKYIDAGAIGEVTGVSAFVPTHGVERHHPNPDFYYAKGGGPLLDLGPYYLAAMVFCLGPIARVAGLSRKTFPERMIENGPRNGQMMPVEVDTHCLSLIEFESGVIGQMMVSFDVWESETPRVEIYGTDGTLCIPDPDPGDGANIFQGPVWLRTRATSRWTMRPRPAAPADWAIAENTHGLNFDARGVGLAEMVQAIRDGRSPRASGALGQHLCEVMQGMLDSPGLGQFVNIQSTCERPPLLPETKQTGLNVDLGVNT
ncbi:Gfo/Idh/MocA family protein [Thalassococcus lentus]|uniref:Gfo/Idh/MocA family oxidoreductase n=1 Tax=Thalassococcus lentus TaxID=1210524 RepID=A0ABT4XXY9_9RHOB|nr:Gfo/Idh/MocA family oxidoreductase [Thalassococcus lentus]MDA7426710.1 Gfo/Idh/MocA family oxidoreductase [Thalassococcus lentus]